MSLPARNYKNKKELEILSAQSTLSLAKLEFSRTELYVCMTYLVTDAFFCNGNEGYISINISDLVFIASSLTI